LTNIILARLAGWRLLLP